MFKGNQQETHLLVAVGPPQFLFGSKGNQKESNQVVCYYFPLLGSLDCFWVFKRFLRFCFIFFCFGRGRGYLLVLKGQQRDTTKFLLFFRSLFLSFFLSFFLFFFSFFLSFFPFFFLSWSVLHGIYHHTGHMSFFSGATGD